MFNRVGLGIFALAMMSTPALAAGSCDTSGPVGPTVPTSAEITAMSIPDAQTRLNGVFKDLHIYQAQLKDYRACLNSAMDVDQRKLNDGTTQKDSDKKKALQTEYAGLAQQYNDSIDAEKTLASQINDASKAHCARDTSDFCKPKN